MESKDNHFNSKNINHLFLKLLPVQIFAQMSSSLSSILNGNIVGNNLSTLDMSALGLITPLISIVIAISVIFSGGIGILYGNLMGKGDNKKINTIFSICINVSIIIGVIVTIICFVFANQFAMLLGASTETLESTVLYLRGISIGIVPMLLSPCLMTYLQMSNESTLTLILTITMAALNAAFDLVDVHILKGGVFGVGVASSLSYYLVVVLECIFIKKKKIVEYHFKEFNFVDLKQIVVFGLPFALAVFLYSIRNVYINKQSQNLGGVVAINALAILSSSSAFIDSFNVGSGNAYRMLASVYVGERDQNSLKKLFKNGLIISEIIIFIKVVVLILFGKKIAILFGATGETVDMAGKIFYYYAISSLFNIPTIFIISTYLSIGKSVYCNVVYLINAFICPMICIYGLSHFIGMDGVLSCYTISEIVTLIFMYLVSAIKNKKIILKFHEFFNLPEDFETKNKLSISIHNMDEVINTSIKVQDFCMDNNAEHKKAMLAGLCVEEMAGNIVEHGFNKDNKKHTIDLFVCVDSGEIIIRIKDDCVPFDPNSRGKIYNPEDPCKNIGIRLVSKMANQLNYQSTFGMNVSTINF